MSTEEKDRILISGESGIGISFNEEYFGKEFFSLNKQEFKINPSSKVLPNFNNVPEGIIKPILVNISCTTTPEPKGKGVPFFQEHRGHSGRTGAWLMKELKIYKRTNVATCLSCGKGFMYSDRQQLGKTKFYYILNDDKKLETVAIPDPDIPICNRERCKEKMLKFLQDTEIFGHYIQSWDIVCKDVDLWNCCLTTI